MFSKLSVFLRKINRFECKKTKNTLENRLKGYAKTILLSIKLYYSKGILGVYVPSLTYSSLFACVPLMAILIAISRGFGSENLMESWICETFYNQPQVAKALINFTSNYLDHTKNSYIIGFGLAIIVYNLCLMMMKTEDAFNHIWETQQRKLHHLLSRHSVTIFIFIILISISLIISIGAHMMENSLNHVWGLHYMAEKIPTIASLLPLALLFFFFYNYIPNAYIKKSSTIIPSVCAGASMWALQSLYVWAQMLLSSYNAIYGSFAALPLFMLWLNLSWHICMYFAVLAYASQNLHHYDKDLKTSDLSYEKQVYYCSILMQHIYDAHDNGKEPMSAENLQEVTDIPQQIVNELLRKLIESKILSETSNGKNGDWEARTTFLPRTSSSKLTFGAMMQRLQLSGHKDQQLNINTDNNPLVEELAKEIDDLFDNFTKEAQQIRFGKTDKN